MRAEEKRPLPSGGHAAHLGVAFDCEVEFVEAIAQQKYAIVNGRRKIQHLAKQVCEAWLASQRAAQIIARVTFGSRGKEHEICRDQIENGACRGSSEYSRHH